MNLAGLTLDAVLGNAKRSQPPPAPSKTNTFLDINIRDDESIEDRKSWKIFRDQLRLKRAGSAWISSIRIPASDVNVQGNNNRSERASTGNPRAAALLARRSSVRFGQNPSQVDDDEDDDDEDEDDDDDEEEEQEDDSVDATVPPPNAFNPQRSRKGDDYTPGTKMSKASSKQGRTLSAREAVAAQEAAEAASKKAATAENTATSPKGTDQEPAQMSLMDLLGDMGEDDDECDDEEEGEEETAQAQGVECNCCVCKVKFTSSMFIPCGHVLCRLCSKEISVERGDCALCDGFILEILEIF